MARQNDQIYEAATNGFANERPLRPLKQLNVLIEQKKQMIQEDPEDLDTVRELKDQIAVLDRQVNSIARLNIVKALLYRGSYDPKWTSSMFPRNTSLHSAAKFGHTAVIEAAIHVIQQGLFDAPDVKCANIKQARAIFWNAAWLQEYLNALWREDGHLPPLIDDRRRSFCVNFALAIMGPAGT